MCGSHRATSKNKGTQTASFRILPEKNGNFSACDAEGIKSRKLITQRRKELRSQKGTVRWPQKKSTAERPYRPKATEGSTCVLRRFSRVQLFEIFLTVARQAPLSMEFPRQEYWSGFPCPPPGHLPNPGIEPVSPAFAGASFSTSAA